MLHLYHSNRLELLTDRLAESISRPLSDPLVQETIVVQHPGMGRWLSLQLSRRLGICANVAFPLPAGYIWQLLRQLLDDVPERDCFQPALIQWWLFDRLGKKLPTKGFAPVQTYLKSADELMRFQLAGEIANCFDQYLVYRPDWIKSWQEDRTAVPGDLWQATLWRELVADQQEAHWVDLQQRLVNAVRTDGINQDRLLERVSLFALSSLSPGYLEILNLAAQWMDIHLYLLNPAEGHWMDLVSEKEKGRRELISEEQALYLDVGNPLLASMGAQGRDFFSLLLAYDPGSWDEFIVPDGAGVLQQLQRDILQVSEGDDGNPRLIDPSDLSLQVHLCHSPMRELEVLHDQLLARFAADSTLQPTDILVMTPDMDTYAPYIEAVFGESVGKATIPYTLSDRSQMSEMPAVSLFMQLLSLPGGRYPVGEILSLLEQPALHQRFGFVEGDLPRIRHWIESVAIRWGRDGADREALGLPLTGQNSWRAGLDRLMLGYALPGEGDQLYQGILPCAEVEGSDVQILGGLHGFVTALFGLEEKILGVYPLVLWEARLNDLIDRFFDSEAEAVTRQIQALRSAIARVVETAGMAGFSGPVSRELVISQLQNQLSNPTSGRFLGGGVNFCALTPMRALPFRVICMIGMNDGLFPKDRQPVGFDLMSGDHRLGDRSRRADDRYLFLETLISAREQLYFSYVGQDIRDNSSLPPSVLLSEVIDTIDSTFQSADGVFPSELLTTRHPLQPFNPRYFMSDSELFSFSQSNRNGAAALLGPVTAPTGFIQQPLTEPDEHWQQIELRQLISFYGNPVRYLFSRRLGITIASDQDQLDSRDPFELDYFQRAELFERLVQGSLTGHEQERLMAVERARGVLPHGTAGTILFDRLTDSANQFVTTLQALDYAGKTQSLPVDFLHGKMRLMGRLEQVGPEGLLGYSLDKIPDTRLLTLWIRHLVLNVTATPDVEPVTRWLSQEGLLTFHPAPQAADLLGDLLELYWQGLIEPLHLFAKSARSYATLQQEGKPRENCLKKARERWFGGYKGYAEYDNPYYRLAFPDGEVLDEQFESLSERVFGPLLSAMEMT